MKFKHFFLVWTILSSPLIASSQIIQQNNSVFKHTYADKSVLAQGHFYKIKIKDNGVYILTYEDLVAMGIAEPAEVRVFGYGGAVLEQSFSVPKIDDLPEVAIRMEKGDDDVFNAGDYILFYGQGAVKWSYDGKLDMFTHKNNTYSDYGYYFVTSDAGEGLRIKQESLTIPANVFPNKVETFTDYAVHEKELISLVKGGKEFYGELFDKTTSYSFPFYFPNTVFESDAAKVRLDVVGASYLPSSFSLYLKGQLNEDIPIFPNNSNYKGQSTIRNYSFLPTDERLEFNLTYNKPEEFAKGYLNYIEVNIRRRLSMVGSVMPFHNKEHIGNYSYNNYILDQVKDKVQVWNITNPLLVTEVCGDRLGTTIHFIDKATEARSYLAVDPYAKDNFIKPEFVGVVPNQNIHAIQQADMVIITHPDFVTPAETLAHAHRQKDAITVTVVTTEQVYNEFSSGTPDATAYRWLMKMLYDRAKETGDAKLLPKYLLLFGKGSFDNRHILEDSGYSYVLTYQSGNSLSIFNAYVTDDYFAYLDNHEGGNDSGSTMDVAVGRFPVTTLQQATDVVDKTIRYMENTDKGLWKSKLCFVADDGDGNQHMIQSDRLANSILTNFSSFHLEKVYIDDYPKEISESGERSPMTKEKILSLLDEGLFYLNYSGHGFTTGWSSEEILTSKDIAVLDNSKLPLWFSAACEVMRFDNEAISAGEQVLLNPSGGGVGSFGAARVSFASQNDRLNKALFNILFTKQNGKYLTIGEAVRRAKNEQGSDWNRLCYIYMGDPAIRLNFAGDNQIQTNRINSSIEFGNDTIRANSSNKIHGCIVNEGGGVLEDFNGSVYVSIYDKPQTIVTRNNENGWEGPFEYENRPLLLSEVVEVNNGVFEYSFTMPQEINENYGTGLIRYYALDTKLNLELQGYFDDFIIGGVEKDTGLDIVEGQAGNFTVTNYPNPAKDHIAFKVSGTSGVRNCIIEIFDLSGRSIHSLIFDNQDSIRWNLTGANGQKVGSGTYFYRARIVTSTGDVLSKSSKFIVLD